MGERTERPGAKLPAVKPVALAGSLMEEEEPEHEFFEVCHAGRGERGGAPVWRGTHISNAHAMLKTKSRGSN